MADMPAQLDSTTPGILCADDPKKQTSASYLCSLSRKYLNELLTVSTGSKHPELEVAALDLLIKEVNIKATSYKVLNSFCFWVGSSMMLVGIAWPAVTELWLKNNGGLSGVIQSVLTAGGLSLLTVHRQYKLRQTKIEDALRRTLFQREEISVKIARLLERVPQIDTGLETPKSDSSASDRPTSEVNPS